MLKYSPLVSVALLLAAVVLVCAKSDDATASSSALAPGPAADLADHELDSDSFENDLENLQVSDDDNDEYDDEDDEKLLQGGALHNMILLTLLSCLICRQE
jgi:hypothetical protein